MELLEFLPALNELAIGALAIIILAYIYKGTLDNFQEQNALHNEQINKLIRALADNSDKLADLVDAVRDTNRETQEQRGEIKEIKDTVNEIKVTIEKKADDSK